MAALQACALSPASAGCCVSSLLQHASVTSENGAAHVLATIHALASEADGVRAGLMEHLRMNVAVVEDMKKSYAQGGCDSCQEAGSRSLGIACCQDQCEGFGALGCVGIVQQKYEHTESGINARMKEQAGENAALQQQLTSEKYQRGLQIAEDNTNMASMADKLEEERLHDEALENEQLEEQARWQGTHGQCVEDVNENTDQVTCCLKTYETTRPWSMVAGPCNVKVSAGRTFCYGEKKDDETRTLSDFRCLEIKDKAQCRHSCKTIRLVEKSAIQHSRTVQDAPVRSQTKKI